MYWNIFHIFAHCVNGKVRKGAVLKKWLVQGEMYGTAYTVAQCSKNKNLIFFPTKFQLFSSDSSPWLLTYSEDKGAGN